MPDTMLNVQNFDNRLNHGIDQLNGKAFIPGSGFTTDRAICVSGAVRTGDIARTDVFIDLTTNSSNAAGDIIGYEAVANCYFGQIKDEINGAPLSLRMECLETPAGGEPDIDVYAAVESTGTEDAAITGLTETPILLAAADWSAGDVKYADVSALDLTNRYLYLVASGDGTDAAYTAGRFWMTFIGLLS